MKNRIRTGYGLTLVELIIVVGFFAVFATVCVRIFISARQISEENATRNHAIIAAESAAECFKAGIAPDLYYSSDWIPVNRDGAQYVLTLAVTEQDGIRKADIRVSDRTGNALFSLCAETLEAFLS